MSVLYHRNILIVSARIRCYNQLVCIEFSKAEQISMNQFIATAVAEKMAALETFDYLGERAKKGDYEHFKNMLSKVPNRKPLKGDEV